MSRVNLNVMKHYMKVPGDVAEMGVNHGSSSFKMVRLAKEYNKRIWLFDSFRGMPHSNDPEDLVQYPKGRFSNNSADKVITLCGDYERFFVVMGWLPGVLNSFTLPFCFVYLDLDHYESTIKTLGVVWDFIVSGGAILCDDYFPSRTILATKAIDEFIERIGMRATRYSNQMLLEKQ